MKIKIIAAILAFVATFGTSSAVTKFFLGTSVPLGFIKTTADVQTQQKMLALLSQDIKNGEEQFGKLAQTKYYSEPFSAASLAAYSKAVTKYQTKSASMDDADLPNDFQAAWRQHMKAWRDHAILVEGLKKSAEIGEVSLEEAYEELENQPNDINRTWYRALRISSRYDASPYIIKRCSTR